LVGDGQTVLTDRRLSQIWQELALHYFWVDYFGVSQLGFDGQMVISDLVGTGSTLFLGGLFWMIGF
jgi:hypothetical protein